MILTKKQYKEIREYLLTQEDNSNTVNWDCGGDSTSVWIAGDMPYGNDICDWMIDHYSLPNAGESYTKGEGIIVLEDDKIYFRMEYNERDSENPLYSTIKEFEEYKDEEITKYITDNVIKYLDDRGITIYINDDDDCYISDYTTFGQRVSIQDFEGLEEYLENIYESMDKLEEEVFDDSHYTYTYSLEIDIKDKEIVDIILNRYAEVSTDYSTDIEFEIEEDDDEQA